MNFLKILIPAFIIYFVSIKFGTWYGAGVALIFVLIYGVYEIPTFLVMKGNKLYEEGNSELAFKYFNKAYKSGRLRGTYAIYYGYLLLKEGKFDEGGNILKEIIDNPKYSFADKRSAKCNYALYLWKKDKLDEAIALLEDVIKEYKNSTVYGTLGYFYILKNDLEKALEFNLEAYDFNDSDRVIADNLGYLRYLLGEYDESEKIYKKLIKQDPKTPVVYYNYAKVCEALGDLEKAHYMLNRALHLKFSALSTISKNEVERYKNEIERKLHVS